MRKIEEQMVAAVLAAKEWRQGNTETTVPWNLRKTNEETGTEFVVVNVWLQRNHIARIELVRDIAGNKFMVHDLRVNQNTLAEWPTRTTKSRLRALGAKV